MIACSYASINTVSFLGLNVIEVKVEVHVGSGLPCFTIVGLPDKNITESKERIKAAFKTLGIAFPLKRVTINLSPTNLPKEGSHYDFPIALGILVATGIVSKELVTNWLVLGEISLNGKLNDIKGILIASLYAAQKGYKLVCALDSSQEVYISGNKSVLVFDNLIDIVSFQKGLGSYCIDESSIYEENNNEENIDINDVIGQNGCKRAFQIAAVFRFNILMIGSPGVGKSMLAKRMKSILPDLSPKEKLEVSMIYSISDKFSKKYNYDIPYRNPHHTCTSSALLGGGLKACPGEISLAHNGILFLDELAEFSRCIEGLRECMETKEVIISRANYCIKFPANCQIIAAMNPCKCGYLDTVKQCRKAPLCATEYTSKISGPLLERFDLIIYMDNNFTYSNDDVKFLDSNSIKQTVQKARDFYNSIYENEIINLKIENFKIDNDATQFLLNYTKKKLLNRRIHDKILKIALSISLLDNSDIIQRKHIAEAVIYFKI